MKKAGFEVVMTEPYVAKFTDATPLVNKIKAAKPDFLFPVSYITDALLIIRTMKQLSVNAGVFGGGAGSAFAAAAGGACATAGSTGAEGFEENNAASARNGDPITRP